MWWIYFLALASAQEELPTVEVRPQSNVLLERVTSPVWQGPEQALLEATQIQDALLQAPGVVFTQNGGFGGRGAFYLRGSESRHTVFLTDGLRLNDPSNTDRHYDTAFLLPALYENVLLLQGPSPVLYGGDATAGVIELIPRRGKEKPETIVSAGAGSFASYHGSLIQDWQRGSHQGTFALSRSQTQGFSRLSRKRFGAQEADGAESTQIQQASRHGWSAKLSTELWVQGVLGEAEQDGATSDEREDETKNRQGSLSQVTRALTSWGEVWLRTGLVSHERKLQTQVLGRETYRGETRLVQLGAEVKHGDLRSLVGVQWDGEWTRFDETHKQNDLASLFVLERLQINDWTLEVGGRGESHQRYGEFFAAEGTVKYQWSEAWSSYGKWARGYKTPSLYQLYAPPLFGFPLGNEDLVSETNQSFEAGLQLQSAGVIELLLFQQEFRDLIVYSNAGYENRGELRVRGVELSGVSPEHRWGQLRLSASGLDYANYQQSPLRRPRYLGSLQWTRTQGRVTTELGLRWLGARKDITDTGRVARLAGYEVLNAALKYAPNARDQWILRLGNVTDRTYEDVWGYSVAPINWQLQYLGRF
ncbi:MAG: TonB-dependent receptor plug domain-containing protein [Bacteriovoracia bacterium]